MTTATVLNLGTMICAIEDQYKPKIYSSKLEALMDSHIWDMVKIHLTTDALWVLGSACDPVARDLTEQEKLYLEQPDEEDYYDDGYDRWDKIYNDRRDEWFDYSKDNDNFYDNRFDNDYDRNDYDDY